MIRVFIFFALSVFILEGASFNCKKARTGIEKQICKDANLSVLDEELAKSYKKVLSWASQNKLSKYEGSSIYHFFKQKQIEWIKQRNRSCKKYKGKEQKECLMSYYNSRIAKLKEFDDGAMVYRNFGNVLYLYTHRPYIIKNFKPYLDKKAYKKLSKEILSWQKFYDVCKNRFGVIDESCAKKVAKEKEAYYDKLLASYKKSRHLLADKECIDLVRTEVSFLDEEYKDEDAPQDTFCSIYKVYDEKQIQKLFKTKVDFTQEEFEVPKNPKACSIESSRLYNVVEESISHITKNIVVVKREQYDYSGGLHGDYESTYFNLDRNTGKEITWKDIFGDKKKVLYSFMVEELKNRIGLSYLEDHSDDELYDMAASSGRMEFTTDGIRIIFGLYEISGYADGEPSFLISLEQLKENMTKEKFAYYFLANSVEFNSVCEKAK